MNKVIPDKKVIKGGSLMGVSETGFPTSVECADGEITRIRPYFYDKTQLEGNQWEVEAHGLKLAPPDHSLLSPYALTYKKRVYSENRVRYPLKRVDWDPNGERHPENRGKSRYVRISWDEAAQLVADELKRVREKYGLEAVLVESDGHGEGKHIAPSHGCPIRLLSMLGPYTVQTRNMDSWEGWHLGARHVWGCEPVAEMVPMNNTIGDVGRNAKMLLSWGCDAETTQMGVVSQMPSRICYWFTKLGIKNIFVDPAFNYTAAVHADKWIPILPNTDAALQLAIAYLWITEGSYEKEYIDTHAYGFDKFADYVLGKEDGIPKTPAWASEKCGVSEWTIKALARQWAKQTTSIVHGNGGCYVRGPYSSEPARLEAMLLGMRGLGRPGVHQFKLIEWNGLAGNNDYPLPFKTKANVMLPKVCSTDQPVAGDIDDDFLLNTGELPPEKAEISPMLADMMRSGFAPGQSIPRCMVHRAILEDHVTWYGLQAHPNRQLPGPDGKRLSTAKYQFRLIEFPRPGKPRIHMVWNDSPCNVTCWNNGNLYIKAMQDPSIECVVAQQPWLENDCYFADIILPVTTKHETVDISDDPASGAYPSIYFEEKCCEPVGESLSDFWVCAKIAEKIDRETYLRYTGQTTDEELCRQLYKVSGAEDYMPWEEFREKQMLVLPVDHEFAEGPAGLYNFYQDPENNRLSTPSGKLEYSSIDIEKYMPDDRERPPVPHWVEKGPAHDERLSSERAEKYPLLCVSNHGRWRMHAQCDDITWNREVETMKIRAKDGYQYEPCWLHPSEAAKRGISHGDIVKVYNERGIVLCAAYVTERLIPQACFIDHGSRLDPIIPGVLDRGGAINTITPTSVTSTKATGMAVSGFLCQVDKVTDEEMAQWKKDYPEAFARKVDEACGVCLDGWMIGEE